MAGTRQLAPNLRMSIPIAMTRSIYTCLMPVSWVQKSDKVGRQVGLTKDLNSSLTLRTLAVVSSVLSVHSRRDTGNSFKNVSLIAG